MADVEIKTKITADTAGAAKSINELNKEIAETKKQLKDAKINSEEYKTAQAQLKTQTESLTKSTAAGAEEHNKSAGAFGILKEKVQSVIPGMKGAEEGTKSFGTTLKALGANPIVLMLMLVVGALKFLYEAFTATKAGADKMEAIFAGVSATVQVVVDRVMKLGGAIIKFFSGDFKGAVADAKGAVTGLGDEIEHAYSRTVELKKKLQVIKKEELEDNLDKSVRQKRLAMLKEMLGDESVSARERLKIAKELKEDAIKNSAEDLDRTRRKVMAEIELIKMKANWEKTSMAEVNQLQIELNNVETENAMEVFRVNKQVKNAQKTIDAEDKASAKEAADKRKEQAAAAKAAAAEAFQYKIRLHKQEGEILLAQTKDAHTKELLQLSQKINDEKKQNEAALISGKLSKEHYNELNANIDKLAVLEKIKIDEKFNDEKKKKQQDFELEMNKIKLEIQLSGITDARKKEQVQMDITYQEKFKQAAQKYKDNEAALFMINLALNLQRKQAEKALEKKYQLEDAKEQQALSLRQIAFQSVVAKNKLKEQKRLLDEKQNIINAQYAAEVLAAEGNALKLADIEQKKLESNYAYTEANKAIAKGERDAKIQALDAVSSTLDNAANLFGKATLAGKVLAIASATISTFTSAQKAYEATVGIPVVGPFLAPINAGLAVAAGLKNIKSITAVQVPGASGGSMPSISAPAPLSPQPIRTSTTLEQSSINGIGNAANGGTTRAFVLDSEIKSNDERSRRINRASRLS